MIIDSHQHVWDPAIAEYEWLSGDAFPELNRRVGFDELEPVLDRLRIDASVLVQAADSSADTAVMLATADRFSRVAGIVAWAPIESPIDLDRHLDVLLGDERVVGVRVLIHDRAAGWIETPSVDRGLAVLSDYGLSYDYVTSSPNTLDALPRIADRHPSLTLVLDHLGKPPIGGDYDDFLHWRAMLADCADRPNVSAKISGLYSAKGIRTPWTIDALRPFVETAIDLFGTKRLMYGSDWPLSTLAGGYEQFWRAVQATLDALSEQERHDVLGANAERIYRLTGGTS